MLALRALLAWVCTSMPLRPPQEGATMSTERKLTAFIVVMFTALLVFTVIKDELACPF